MADVDENDLLAIGIVDTADDSADDDSGTHHVPRTFQSEADFQLQQASYTAKISDGNHYEALLDAVPVLKASSSSQTSNVDASTTELAKTALNKKDVHLLGYAVGEMYYDHRYDEIVNLCQRIRQRCCVDARLAASLDRWTTKSQNQVNR